MGISSVCEFEGRYIELWREGHEGEVKMKRVLVPALLLCASLAARGDDKHAYPRENLAQFVLANVDVTSLPSAFRPKKEKGKKTFADYGFTPQTVDENEAVIETADGLRMLDVLDQTSKGIYVCFDPDQSGGGAKTQSVVLLKRKDPSARLKARESFREFAACPVIGETDSTLSSNGGD